MRTVAVLLVGSFLCVAGPAFAEEDGAALYTKNCASCHGPDGKAETPAAKAMKVPPLSGLALTPDEVVAKIKASDKHKALAAKLSDAELKAIAGALPKG
jgi:mono/diheme cytochrome c family protein